eukprot:8716482-Lingulodinium_polyedra.AAC.1
MGVYDGPCTRQTQDQTPPRVCHGTNTPNAARPKFGSPARQTATGTGGGPPRSRGNGGPGPANP